MTLRARDALRKASPSVDHRALLARARRRRPDRGEQVYDPCPRLGRVDHVVNHEVSRAVQRLAGLIGFRDHLFEEPQALLRVLDRREFGAKAELDLSLDAHRRELAGRPQIGRAPSELQSLMRLSYAVFCLKKKI